MSGTILRFSLVNWLWPYRSFLWLAILILLLIVIFSSLLPLIIKEILDRVLTNQEQEAITAMIFVLIGLITLRAVANYSANFLLSWIEGKLSVDLQRLVLEKALVLPVGRFEQQDVNKFYTDKLSKVSIITELSTQVIFGLAKDGMTCMGLIGVMFYINRDAAVLGIFLMLITALVGQIMSKKQIPPNNQLITHTKSADLFQHIIKYIRSIKIDNGLSQEGCNFYQLIDKQRLHFMKPVNGNFVSQLMAAIVSSMILTASSYYLLHEYYLYKITLSEMVAVVVALVLLFPAFTQFFDRFSAFKNGFTAIQQFNGFLIQAKESSNEGQKLGTIQGAVAFEDLELQTSSLPANPITSLSLNIQPKEVVVLTAANLELIRSILDCLLRFNQPISGKIMLDGNDITTLKISEINANIAWLSPDIPLLEDTIAANIAYGGMQCTTEAKLTAVARICNVTDFVREMPYGFQTRIDMDGLDRSVELEQCILLARILLKNPAIVIIDESSAEFSLENEKVNQAFNALIHERTTIIISMRPAMTQRAQRTIIVSN